MKLLKWSTVYTSFILQYSQKCFALCWNFTVNYGGGVEDTRLEAKAKDTKKSKAKDSLSEDRHSRGQGQECSRPRPRTQAQVLSKRKKKGLHKNFSGDLQKKKKGLHENFLAISTKKRYLKNFSSAPQNFSNSKNFKKYCCPRAEYRPIFEDLRSRGQGQGLDLRGQGQGLQNLFSRTPPLVNYRSLKKLLLYRLIY